MNKIELAPEYSFSCESSGRDGWVEEGLVLEAKLTREQLEEIVKDGLKAFVDRCAFTILPYERVLAAVLKKHNVADVEALSKKCVYATDSGFVGDMSGFYGSFFDDVMWGRKGLIPPSGQDDCPDPAEDESFWPTAKDLEKMTPTVVLYVDGTALLQWKQETGSGGEYSAEDFPEQDEVEDEEEDEEEEEEEESKPVASKILRPTPVKVVKVEAKSTRDIMKEILAAHGPLDIKSFWDLCSKQLDGRGVFDNLLRNKKKNKGDFVKLPDEKWGLPA